MNVLWSHEMGYPPDCNKIEILIKYGLKPFYLHLDYEKKKLF